MILMMLIMYDDSVLFVGGWSAVKESEQQQASHINSQVCVLHSGDTTARITRDGCIQFMMWTIETDCHW